jgi:hypothetical protein
LRQGWSASGRAVSCYVPVLLSHVLLCQLYQLVARFCLLQHVAGVAAERPLRLREQPLLPLLLLGRAVLV